MTDSVNVFSPGFRLTDSATGAPLSGAVIEFYDAGTTNPKTVYADAALTSSLGTSVTTDSLGYPTSDGSTKTLVWVGTSAYKVVIKTSAAVVIATHDNINGAVATVTPGDTSVISTRPVVTKSLNYTVLSADQSTVFAGNCSGGDVTFTLPSAVTVGLGWLINIQHAGSANQVTVATVSSQTISDGSKSFGTSYPLTFNGEEIMLVSDGGNWRVSTHTNPFLKGSFGILPIVSRTNTPPGSSGQGDMHILTSGPTGAWSGFAEHDIALYTGAAWINFTPPTNIGWIAWVQGEALAYKYSGSAWVVETATTTLAGTVRLADAAAMEAQTAARAVTADLMARSPGVAKAWVSWNGTGTAAVRSSYNVTGITDNGTGDYTFGFTTVFSAANYAVGGSASKNSAAQGGYSVMVSADNVPTTSALRVSTGLGDDEGNTDIVYGSVTVFGDQ